MSKHGSSDGWPKMAALPVTSHGFILRPVAEVEAALADAGFARVERRQVQGTRLSFHVLTALHPGTEQPAP